jgi:hypothetical protein
MSTRFPRAAAACPQAKELPGQMRKWVITCLTVVTHWWDARSAAFGIVERWYDARGPLVAEDMT